MFRDIFRVRYLTSKSLARMDSTKLCIQRQVHENLPVLDEQALSIEPRRPGVNPELSKIDWVTILGCPITKLSLEGFVARIEEFIKSAKPRYVAMVNVAKLVKMHADKELEQSVLAADLIGADGVPLVWVSRLFGNPLPGRVNGTDLMYALLERASEKGYRIFFLGAKEEILQKILEVVCKDYPGVKIAGAHHGYFTFEEEATIVNKIRESQADILFIAFGTPKKELWVKRYLHVMEVRIVHGVGGSFDVLAGVIPRAPLWMQSNGLEWLFRLFQEPRRMWRRYLITNTLFMMLVVWEWLRYRLGLIPPQIVDDKPKQQ
jgi:N-acetylglucosaminyldiphosphoundecaprenol N-acetyl-beta-D-mannosaminyltransferase